MVWHHAICVCVHKVKRYLYQFHAIFSVMLLLSGDSLVYMSEAARRMSAGLYVLPLFFISFLTPMF